MALSKNSYDYDEEEDEFESEEDSQRDKFITFKIDIEEYGIEIKYVSEIIGIQKITTLPDMPDYVKGVVNLRGKIIPIIDIRLKFGMIEKVYNNRTCIIVVNLEEATIGLIVDEVSEVIDIPENQIEPLPKTGKKTRNRYINGIGKVGEKVKIILDISKILSEEELTEIVEAA
jgi:purine-binding chemotaxis protein CheW